MNNQSDILYLDSYMVYIIISFLNNDDNFILYEVSKYFKNFIDKHNISKINPCSQDIISRFEMLNWAESHPTFKYSKKSIEYAIKVNNIEIVKYLIDKSCSKRKKCYNEAVRNLNFKIIKLLNKYDFPKNSDAFVVACELGSLRMVKLLDKYDFPHDIRFSNTCARLGRLNCLKWIIKNNYVWDTCTFHHASASGDLRVMKFLYSMSCNDISKPWWNIQTFIIAVKYNNIEIINFLMEKGCSWKSIVSTNCAFDNGHIDTLKNLITKGCPVSQNVYRYLWENNMIHHYDKIVVF